MIDCWTGNSSRFCWSSHLLKSRLLQNLPHNEALVAAVRPAGLHCDKVSDLSRLVLVVDLVFSSLPHLFFVDSVLDKAVDVHNGRLHGGHTDNGSLKRLSSLRCLFQVRPDRQRLHRQDPCPCKSGHSQGRGPLAYVAQGERHVSACPWT